MSAFLYRLGRGSARHPWRVIGLWLLAAIVVVSASNAFGAESEDSFSAPGVDSQRAVDLLSAAENDRAGITARVVVASGGDLSGSTDRRRLDTVHSVLADLPNVVDVSEATAPDGSMAILTVQYPVLEALEVADLERLEHGLADLRDDTGLTIEAGGELFFNFDEPGSGAEELIGLAAAVVILLVAFGSVVAMGLPIGVALFGLAVGVSAMPLIGRVIAVPSFAPQFGTMIGLGVGIDYALFLVTRHREFLSRGLTPDDAAGRAVATAGQAVVFAGGTVVVAILGLAIAGIPFITATGIATSVMVLLMVTASLTLLPAFLGVSGHWVNRLGIHRRGHTPPTVSARWRRWGAHVSRRAWPYTIGVTVLLLALTAPVLALRLGFPDDGSQPTSRTERRAYDLAADGFGPGINGPLIIAVDLDGDTAVLEPLSEAVAADPGVAAVAPPEVDEVAGVATLVAFPTTTPQDDATWDTVRRLRADVFPAVLDGTGASAHIGGQTASFGDVASRISDRLPWLIGSVVAVSFVLLLLVFRSVLVPIKAAFLNLLSIGAAYGLLVMVFQWGWGKGLIGLESTVPIVSFIPMIMFAVLFGLSMDYEVFLLSRVRESYVATGDNHEAVVSGLASTARVITSAALIMISVFGVFVLGDDTLAKMMGLGLATAIFVDATIVRMVLVPATMTLMGDANWWLPGWLDRLLPHLDLESGDWETETPEEADRERPPVLVAGR